MPLRRIPTNDFRRFYSINGKTKKRPYGIASETSKTVLLLVDVINDFDFPEGEKLLRFALPAARRIAALKTRLRKRSIPAIYVNGNFGRWQSDFKKQVERCTSEAAPGAEVARLLIPGEDDYFVLKPKHSGFYSTSLETLLSHLGARKLIITGFAADICVLFTANDAYMRDFQMLVPSDCIALPPRRYPHISSNSPRLTLKMSLELRPPLPPMETVSVDAIPECQGWQYGAKSDGFR